jgi:hypothetical protein
MGVIRLSTAAAAASTLWVAMEVTPLRCPWALFTGN